MQRDGPVLDRAALERLLRYCAYPPLPWIGYAKRVQSWYAAAPNSSRSPGTTTRGAGRGGVESEPAHMDSSVRYLAS